MALPKKVQDQRNELVKKVIKDIESGKPFFWDCEHYGKRPRNLLQATKGQDVYYKGINSMQLILAAREKGYKDSRWATYKQAQMAGGNVKRGEKGTPIEYWQYTRDLMEINPKTGKKEPVFVKNEETGKMEKVKIPLNPPIVKSYVVFNAEQIEGIEKEIEHPITIKKEDTIQQMENMLKNSEAPIIYDQSISNYYSITEDKIHLMPKEKFRTMDGFYSTASHEIAHSTGATSRLDRETLQDRDKISYAKEELRAEMTSMFLQQKYNIRFDEEHYKNHSAYLQGWAKALKDDPNEIYRAAAEAEKAMMYIETRMIQKNLTKVKTNELDVKPKQTVRKRKLTLITTPKKSKSNQKVLSR